MSKLQVEVIEKTEDKSIFGLWMNSNDRSVSKDIPVLSGKYYEIAGKKESEVFPFYVLSKDYNVQTREFKLFIGGFMENSKLDRIELLKGYYGVVAVKPKLGFLWGLSIGEVKRYFYTQWLPKSNYKALNMEYEYHTDKSVGRSPEIEIYFSIDKKC